jgi:mono/diheme cytochrome c family protein
MKKVLRITGYLLFAVIFILLGLSAYVKVALPDVGAAPDITVDRSASHVARGKYLANCVTVCMDCHSARDWSRFSGPLTPGTLGQGGERFDQKEGFPGVYYSRNITPVGVSRYSDGELFRLITTGVTKEGRAMFPVMPYPYYGHMDPEDIKCIIAYIRSLTPINNQVPESVSNFPMNLIINTIPGKATPQKISDPSNRVAYGSYLVNAAACMECHTPVKGGQVIRELAFSGGREFNLPDGSVVRSRNLTPDAATGIGSWTEETFLSRFKTYADSSYRPALVKPGEFNTIMPWTMYAKMTKEDLSAIYAYLRQIKPVQHSVVKFSPAENGIVQK